MAVYLMRILTIRSMLCVANGILLSKYLTEILSVNILKYRLTYLIYLIFCIILKCPNFWDIGFTVPNFHF